MFALHAKDDVSPAKVAGGDLDAGSLFRARAAGLVARVGFEKGLDGGAALLIPRADEKELGFHTDEKKPDRSRAEFKWRTSDFRSDQASSYLPRRSSTDSRLVPT